MTDKIGMSVFTNVDSSTLDALEVETRRLANKLLVNAALDKTYPVLACTHDVGAGNTCDLSRSGFFSPSALADLIQVVRDAIRS